MFTAFIILAFISLSKGQNDECSLRGECLSSVHVAGKFAPNEKECLLHCKNTTGNYFNFQVADFRDNLFFKDCGWYTFHPNGNFCELFKNCANLSDDVCQGYTFKYISIVKHQMMYFAAFRLC